MNYKMVNNHSYLWILLLSLIVAACTPLIGPYSPTAYKYATSLKAETLALMDKATEPYSDHKADVDRVSVELRKAYEFVKGVPSNSISAKQWEILIDPEGDLVGKFLKRWKESGDLSETFVTQFMGPVSDAFDEIICLEASKKEATDCRPVGSE